MIRILPLALACLCFVLPLQAQVEGSFPVRRYGTEQGLGSDVVSSLVQDPAGRLWVGTEGGLCFFDGRRFSPFTGPLPSQFVLSLFVDLDGALWVSTEGGVARISHGQSRIISPAAGIPPGPVQEVGRDAEGHLWVLTSEGIRVERAPHGFVAPTPWPGQELPTHLFASPSLPGAWAITSRTIWYWRENSWIRLASPPFAPGEILLDVAVDGDRNLWVRTRSSLWHRPVDGAPTWIGSQMAGGLSHLSRLSRDAEGWVWVDSTTGLGRMRGNRTEQFGHAQDDARGGMVDQEGGLWLRTDKGVLRVLGQTRWRIYGPPDGLPQETCWQMTRDRRGRLWVGTDSGLWVSEGRWFKRVIKGRLLTLVLGKDETLWASGSPAGTIFSVDTQSHAVTAHRIQALPVARITAALTVDAEGHPWVADLQGGLVRGSRGMDGWTWETMLIEGSPPRDVRNIFALPGNGVLLMHDRSASIWRHGEWHRVPDLLAELPYTAAIGPDGKLVIGYLNRPVLTVHRLQGEKVVRTAVLDLQLPGKPLGLTVFSLAFGNQERLWIGTSHGLGSLTGENVGSFRILGAEDRIVSAECNQNAVLVEPDLIWIGTPTGLMSHIPLVTAPREKLRPPVLISATARNQELDLTDPLPELQRANNELDVDFMVPNYQLQGSLLYEAKLSGVDADWLRVGTPHLRYTALQAGPHVLQVRGLTTEGLRGPITAFHFRVRAAWWERWWVQALGLLGIMGLTTALVKARQAQLERRNRELVDEVARQTSELVAASKAKSAFLANMSHELRTPLNAILLYSEIMQEDMQDPVMSGHRSDAGKIHGAGQHLLGLIDDILDLSKIEAGHLRLDFQQIAVPPFLHDLDATIRPLAEKNGNRFELDLHRVPDHICSDPTRLRQILVNLLSNSAKFTREGTILLRARGEGEQLLLTVQDSGIGMTEEQQTRVFQEFVQADDSTTRKFGGTGLGLTLVKKFTDLLGGELALQSMPDQGTTFTLKFPLAGPPREATPGVPPVELPPVT
jgi:signal transduction histidine kinase/ligand-binding sensor domain-containing protein